MDASLLGFLIALVVSAIVVFPLGKPLRKHPSVFYAVAAVFVVLYVWALWTGANLAPVRALTAVLQKGYVASILLAVVMFTGCLDEGSKLRRKLQPIRGELSILSFIFILGHLAAYAPSYLRRIDVLFSTRSNIAFSLTVALVLTALFLVLTVTSVRALHKRMSPKAWKGLQRFSYLMVVLLIVHVGFVLGRSAIADPTSQAMFSLVVYLVVVVLYAVLRIRKALRDKKSLEA